MAALLFSDVSIHNGETRVNIKCETEREGVSVVETWSIFEGRLWNRRAATSLIREHRRQHQVNSLHSSMLAVPCGQRIKATAFLIEQARQHSLCRAWRRLRRAALHSNNICSLNLKYKKHHCITNIKANKEFGQKGICIFATAKVIFRKLRGTEEGLKKKKTQNTENNTLYNV